VLGPGASVNVDVCIGAAANVLAVGSYNDTVTFSNATSGEIQTRDVSLQVNDALAVSPGSSFASSGDEGGPFSPVCQAYDLVNNGGSALSWSAHKAAAWLDVSSAGGVLAAGATTTVNVCIGATASGLAAGPYADAVVFSNAASGAAQSRSVSLVVNSTNNLAGFYAFDGINDYIAVPDASSLTFGFYNYDDAFSVAAWVKMDDAGDFVVLSKDNGSAESHEYAFSCISGQLQFTLVDALDWGIIGRRYTTSLTSYEGQWIHVAATYSGNEAESGIDIYVNGAAVDDASTSSGDYVAMDDKAVDLHIGRHVSQYGDGSISGVRVYSRELSVAEVTTLHTEGRGAARDAISTSGLVLSLPFSHAVPDWEQIAQLAANTQAYSDTGLTGDTVYQYRVKAINAGGESDYSNIASAETAARPALAGESWSADAGPGEASAGDSQAQDSQQGDAVAGGEAGASSSGVAPEMRNDGAPGAAGAAVRRFAPGLVLASSGTEPHTNAWAVVDGDLETLWMGGPDAGGWWLAIVYDRVLSVSDIVLHAEPDSIGDTTFLGSTDTETWNDLEGIWDAGSPAELRYLWIIFADDGSGTPPAIYELVVETSPQ